MVVFHKYSLKLLIHSHFGLFMSCLGMCLTHHLSVAMFEAVDMSFDYGIITKGMLNFLESFGFSITKLSAKLDVISLSMCSVYLSENKNPTSVRYMTNL